MYCIYMDHHFILLRLNPFNLSLGLIGRDGGLNTLCSNCLSAEGVKNVSWPWLSPLRGWGSLTMSLTGKFVYVYIYKFASKWHSQTTSSSEWR